MAELLAVLLAALAVAGVLALMAARAEAFQRRVEELLSYVSVALILFVMAFVLAEVTMRFAFNSPSPATWRGRSCYCR